MDLEEIAGVKYHDYRRTSALIKLGKAHRVSLKVYRGTYYCSVTTDVNCIRTGGDYPPFNANQLCRHFNEHHPEILALAVLRS